VFFLSLHSRMHLPQTRVNALATLLATLVGRECVFERRSPRWMFTLRNYGDVPGTINDADGDPYDVFAPGVDALETGTPFTITHVVGVFFLENGNHKIAVRVDHPGGEAYDATRARYEVASYCATYTAMTKHEGKWMEGDAETLIHRLTAGRSSDGAPRTSCPP